MTNQLQPKSAKRTDGEVRPLSNRAAGSSVKGRLLGLVILFSFSIPLFGIAGGTTVMAQTIKESYQWNNRVLLLFSESSDNILYQKQLDLISTNQRGYTDRDIVVVKVVGQAVKTFPSSSRAQKFSAAELRAAYNAEQTSFRSILIGKDGGVKLDRNEPVESCALFQLIDGMPMRLREIREQGYKIGC